LVWESACHLGVKVVLKIVGGIGACVKGLKKTAERFSLRPCSFHSLRSLGRKGSSVFFSVYVTGGFRVGGFYLPNQNKQAKGCWEYAKT